MRVRLLTGQQTQIGLVKSSVPWTVSVSASVRTRKTDVLTTTVHLCSQKRQLTQYVTNTGRDTAPNKNFFQTTLSNVVTRNVVTILNLCEPTTVRVTFGCPSFIGSRYGPFPHTKTNKQHHHTSRPQHMFTCLHLEFICTITARIITMTKHPPYFVTPTNMAD